MNGTRHSAIFEWREHCRFFSALHWGIGIRDAARDRSMSPNLDIVCSIKGIAGGMIEVMVRIECSFYRHLTYATKSLHLECGSCRADKALTQKRAVFSGEKAAVAHGLQAFGDIGNSGVEAIADSSDRRETLSATTVCDKRESFCRAASNGGNGSRKRCRQQGRDARSVENMQSSLSPIVCGVRPTWHFAVRPNLC